MWSSASANGAVSFEAADSSAPCAEPAKPHETVVLAAVKKKAPENVALAAVRKPPETVALAAVEKPPEAVALDAVIKPLGAVDPVVEIKCQAPPLVIPAVGPLGKYRVNSTGIHSGDALLLGSRLPWPFEPARARYFFVARFQFLESRASF